MDAECCGDLFCFRSGFAVFYDIVSGLDVDVAAVQLYVSLHNATGEYGEPSVLPLAYTGDIPQMAAKFAIISARQPVQW